ncbi:MAG: class D sortase [Acetivibrionales bacterium]|jgi:sortase A
MEKKEKRRIGTVRIFAIILLSAGILFIMVPAVNTYLNIKRNNDIIDEFLRQSETAATNIEFLDEEVEDFYIPPELSGNTQTNPNNSPLPEEASEPQEPEDSPATVKKSRMSKEEMQRRTTGVLLIPKIDVKMLIMDGVDDDTLRVAVGRLPYTDNFDEIGNCVLAGHRSYTFGKYLHRLNELKIGDKITVQTKEKTLNYTIYNSKIIEPDDFSIIEKNDTDKILTVFTCHPPGIGSHRLVVQATQDE